MYREGSSFQGAQAKLCTVMRSPGRIRCVGSKSHTSLKAETHQSSPLSDVAGVSAPNQGTHTTSSPDSAKQWECG